MENNELENKHIENNIDQEFQNLVKELEENEFMKTGQIDTNDVTDASKLESNNSDEKQENNESKSSKKEKIKKDKSGKKKMGKVKKTLLVLLILFLLGIGSGLFLLYGPWPWFRETLITTAMTTMNHQYLATWFYDDETIQKVLNQHAVIESGEETDVDQITIKDVPNNVTVYESIYEEQILKKDPNNDLYKIVNISGTKYKGYLVVIYDPSKVKIAVSSSLGSSGQLITRIAKDNNAVIAINASGFEDPDWNSNGARPHGMIIKDGKLIWNNVKARVGGGLVGFTKDNKLILGNMTAQQALNKGVRDAMEFGPYLIVNGKPSFIKGNGGWGIAPRTAVGQRQDGIVLFLVIDGRTAASVGADMVDLTEIMQRYKAYNAANMDGGSSTSLIVKNEIYSKPVAGGKNGLRAIPNAWIVVE